MEMTSEWQQWQTTEIINMANDRMTEWQNDRMTEWQNDRMTGMTRLFQYL